MAQWVSGRLRPRIFSTFGTTGVVGRQPKAPAALPAGEIPGTHFQRLSRLQGTWFCLKPQKKSPVTPPGIDPGTIRLLAQRLNHYATPDPGQDIKYGIFILQSESLNIFTVKKTGFSVRLLLMNSLNHL